MVENPHQTEIILGAIGCSLVFLYTLAYNIVEYSHIPLWKRILRAFLLACLFGCPPIGLIISGFLAFILPIALFVGFINWLGGDYE